MALPSSRGSAEMDGARPPPGPGKPPILKLVARFPLLHDGSGGSCRLPIGPPRGAPPPLTLDAPPLLPSGLDRKEGVARKEMLWEYLQLVPRLQRPLWEHAQIMSTRPDTSSDQQGLHLVAKSFTHKNTATGCFA